ncbi:MAG: CPBP family intramembrane glutamic endopeptidase [Candidatus Omnitrophota bacterium]
MEKEAKKSFFEAYFFIAVLLAVSFLTNQMQSKGIGGWYIFAPFAAGIISFVFQIFLSRRPLVELYSKGYPYRKLKPYGVISAFLLFELVLAWGLYTKQIQFLNKDLFLITVVLTGVIAYYHSFVRMKISLRFLFLAIFVPLVAAGVALGMGSYFDILKFTVPAKPVGDAVFFNTIYWILFYIFLQMACEEPAFRGYLMQKLIARGEVYAILFSSLVFSAWRFFFVFYSGADIACILLASAGNFIMAVMFALLFVKGRNLLVAAICHGIIDGLYVSIFSLAGPPGIREYINFLTPYSRTQLLAFWVSCLFIGLILLTFIPRKKLHAR